MVVVMRVLMSMFEDVRARRIMIPFWDAVATLGQIAHDSCYNITIAARQAEGHRPRQLGSNP